VKPRRAFPAAAPQEVTGGRVTLRRLLREAGRIALPRRAQAALVGRWKASRVAAAVGALDVARRSGVPVFLDDHFRPRWVLDRGPVVHRVFLTTIPKAGTYMVAKMLPRLGVENCGIHVGREAIVDQRFAPMGAVRFYPGELSRHITLADSVALIGPGQFAFGHIGLDGDATRTLFADFKLILMVRNLRDVWASLRRYFRERRDMSKWEAPAAWFPEWKEFLAWDMAEDGPYQLIGYRRLAAWRGEPNVVCVRYEELVGDDGRDAQVAALDRLQQFLGVGHPREALEDVLNTVVGQPTATKMPTRTVAAEWWSDDIERLYRRIGFAALNRELGYEEPA
jgi:hypothetical protein